MVKDIVLAMVKKGDVVEIEPIDKLPNLDRKFKVDEVLKEGFLYGCSITCDGYVMPFWAIKNIKIVG